jgi:hypothetical protein
MTGSARQVKRPVFAIELLEDRIVPSKTLTVGPGAAYQFNTISQALAAAQPNTTIDVFPGTYNESPVINKNGIKLVAVGGGVVVQPISTQPVILSGVNVGGAAIDVSANNVTVNGFTVDGLKETDGNLWVGIRIAQGGSATIANNTVENITSASDPNSNIGIDIGLSQVSPSQGAGSANVYGNTITAYSGAGVLVDGSTAWATVQGNTITGRGTLNGGVVEFGVQVSNGASATIQCNTITGNTLLGAAGAPNNPSISSAGVFVLNESGKSSSVSVTSNSISGNDDGVLVQQSSGSRCGGIQIANNTIQKNYGYAGVFVLSSSNVDVTCNTICSNQTYNGIALNGSSSVSAKNNQISFTGIAGSQSDGIYDYNGSCDQISCNTTTSNSGNGINLQSSSNDTVSGNVAKCNTLSGFQDLDGTNDSFWLNLGSGNANDGMILIGASGDVVAGNFLTLNAQYGLQLQGATNTQIFLNATRGNTLGSIAIDSASLGTSQYWNLQ